jgi:enediyne biosynthesis thioesterase
MRFYEYRHRISFEETNVVGNVYYAHYVRWQGRCREMFIHDHAPQVLEDLAQGLTLATTRVSCSYYQELSALDEVLIRMSASSMSPGRLTMLFQYFRVAEDGGEILIAEGEQEVACVLRVGSHLQPAPLPAALRHAVEKYITPMAEPVAGR